MNQSKTFLRSKFEVLLLLLALAAPLPLSAQAGLDSLSMKYVFADSSIMRTAETEVEGGQLKKWNMTRFHSITFTLNSSQQQVVAKRLERDMRRAVSKEVQRRNGQVSFALLQYDRKGSKRHSYLIFHQKESDQCVCVYIEGEVTVGQIKQMFYK